jgi:uncharacterized protein YraI
MTERRIEIISRGATQAKKLLITIAIAIMSMVTMMPTLIAYYVNVHDTILERYGPATAWTLIGIIGTLLAISLLFLL